MNFWIYCGKPMTEGQIHTARQNLDIPESELYRFRDYDEYLRVAGGVDSV
jgi:hypothetical protein